MVLLPRHCHGGAARVPSKSWQFLRAMQMLLPLHGTSAAQKIYCYQRPRGPGLTAAHNGQSCLLILEDPHPHPPISGAGDAFQRCREKNDNMYSSSTQKSRRTKTAPPGGCLGELGLDTPFVHLWWVYGPSFL